MKAAARVIILLLIYQLLITAPAVGNDKSVSAPATLRHAVLFSIKSMDFIVPLEELSILEFLDKSIGYIPNDIVKDGLPHFGAKRDDWLDKVRPHRGFDIYRDKVNVVASGDGRVIKTGEGKRAGKYIKIKHDHGVATLYIHLSEIFVSKGRHVDRGDVIGHIHGPTGNAVSPQLHFEIQIDNRSLDPLILIENYYRTETTVIEKLTEHRLTLPAIIATRDKMVSDYLQGKRKRKTGTVKLKAATSPDYTIYTVKRGDSLSGIALKFNTTVSRIGKINQLKNLNAVMTNSKLKIPLKSIYHPETQFPKGRSNNLKRAPEFYRVKPGDTLWRICRNFGVSVEALKQHNNIKGSNIYSGQRIKIIFTD